MSHPNVERLPYVPLSEIVDANIDTLYWDEDDWLIARVYYDNEGSMWGFEDSLIGMWEGNDEDDAIGNYLREIYDTSELPEWARYYVDWEKMGRDARLSGDVWTEEIQYGTFVLFWNH